MANQDRVPARQAAPVDAVITWVDGSAPSHRRALLRHLKQAGPGLHENAVNPHRWGSSDEISFCLRSIEAHAPWIRTVWIVAADGQAPRLNGLTPRFRARIRMVPHSAIYRGFEAALPTFNSLSIESLLWRIEGLSERFIYFNDDVFLTAPLLPGDVFRDDMPVLRGGWRDFSGLLREPRTRDDPALFHHWMQVNAARLAGFAADRLFSSAHVVHPMRRSVMAGLFERHRDSFAQNVGHRFRDMAQFLPQGLHNHACLATGRAVIATVEDHVHLKSGGRLGDGPEEVRAALAAVLRPGVKFMCVNDLPQLERQMPDLRDWLAAAVGAPRLSA